MGSTPRGVLNKDKEEEESGHNGEHTERLTKRSSGRQAHEAQCREKGQQGLEQRYQADCHFGIALKAHPDGMWDRIHHPPWTRAEPLSL